MPVVRTPTQGTSKHVDPGTYRVRCLDLKEDKLDNSQFGTGEVIRFNLRLTEKYDENGEDIDLDAIANDKLTPKSKLWGWLTAFGVHLDMGVSCNIEEAIGKEAFAVIIDNLKDGTAFSKVEDIIPLPKSGGAPASGPALVKPDGGINFIAFWKRCESAGVTKQDVANFRDLTIDGLSKELSSMTPDEVIGLLEEVTGVSQR